LVTLLAGCGNGKGEANSSTPIASTSSIDTSYATDSSEKETKDVISLLSVGDNLIHSQIYDDSETSEVNYDFKHLYSAVATEIKESDLAFVNQESILGGDDLGFSTYPAFNTPSQMAENLADLGFNLVSIANNHSLDKGSQGVMNTLRIWDKVSDRVLYTGAFDSQEDRDTIPTITVKGVTFALLAYTYGTNGIQPDVPYRLNYFNEELVQ